MRRKPTQAGGTQGSGSGQHSVDALKRLLGGSLDELLQRKDAGTATVLWSGCPGGRRRWVC